MVNRYKAQKTCEIELTLKRFHRGIRYILHVSVAAKALNRTTTQTIYTLK